MYIDSWLQFTIFTIQIFLNYGSRAEKNNLIILNVAKYVAKLNNFQFNLVQNKP